jgi:hypothetical protein
MGASLRLWGVVYRVLLVWAVVCAASVSAAGDEPEVGWTDFFDANGFRGDLTDLCVLKSHRVFQVSSYDRMGGNADGAYHLEKIEEGLLLADLQGPGAILRIWSPQPAGTLRLYIDGELWPRFNWQFEDVFGGHLVPFRAPLVNTNAGGFINYVPIPYKKSCRVVLAGHATDVYYQVTACEFDDAAELVSFESDMLTRSDRSYFRRMKRLWSRPGRYTPVLDVSRLVSRKRVIWPTEDMKLAEIDGPGVIEGIWLELESRDIRCTDKVSIEAYWDDETDPSILAMVSSFFGTRYTDADFRSLPIGNRDGQMYCYFPMPFQSKARIVLHNFSKEKVVARTWVAWRREDSLGEDIGMFHAQGRATTAELDKPVTLLDARGRGQYVGCVLSASNPETLRFLEGDEQIFVDDETIPSIHGTGTADYFNGGRRFMGESFATATHGATAIGKTETGHHVTAYRLHLTDYIPFGNTFRMQLEHGAINDAPGTQYYTAAFWYQAEPHMAQMPTSSVPEKSGSESGLVLLVQRHKTAAEYKADAARAAASAQAQQGAALVQIEPPASIPPSP